MNNQNTCNLASEEIIILELLSEKNDISASEIVKLSNGKLNETETRLKLPSLVDQRLVTLNKTRPSSVGQLEIHKYSLSDIGRQFLINFEKSDSLIVDSKEKNILENLN